MRDLSGVIATPNGMRIVPIQFIQRNLDRLVPHIRPKHGQRIHKGPAMLHMRQRHQVLRVQFRRHTQPPIAENAT